MATDTAAIAAMSYEEALSTSKAVQKHADKYILVGACLMGTCVFGLIGLPIFLYGVWLLQKAENDGLAVRPAMMTFVGALVLMDGFLNTMGWMIDVFAHHSLIIRVFEMGWSLLLDNGYAWNYPWGLSRFMPICINGCDAGFSPA